MSQEVPGVQGKAIAPERCPESSGRGLRGLPACGIFLSSLVVFCASVVSPGASRRSLEVRESLELWFSSKATRADNPSVALVSVGSCVLAWLFLRIWLFLSS